MRGLIEKRDELAQRLQNMIEIRDSAINREIENQVSVFRNALIQQSMDKRVKTEEMIKIEKMIEALNEVIDFENEKESPIEVNSTEIKEEVKEDIIPVEEVNIVSEPIQVEEITETIESIPEPEVLEPEVVETPIETEIQANVERPGMKSICEPERG